MLAGAGKGSTSIQLYYTTASDDQQDRLERFLVRAKGVGKLSETYILPMDINGKPGYRVLYGFYQNIEEGKAGMEQLPQRFKVAFTPALYSIDNKQAAVNFSNALPYAMLCRAAAFGFLPPGGFSTHPKVVLRMAREGVSLVL